MLQEDIDNLVRWCEENRLYFNKDKCAIFTATRSNTIINNIYTIGNHVIERKNEIRDLGVMVDRHFSFTHHMEQKMTQAKRIIGLIKYSTRSHFTIDTQRILYLSLVRPILEFASVIWSPYHDIYVNEIESIQKQFIIYLQNSRRNATSFRLVPYFDRCSELNIQPLCLRRQINDALFAFDLFVKNINDPNLNNKFIRVEDNSYSLRQQRFLIDTTYRTDYSRHQPIARLIRLINKFCDIINFRCPEKYLN